MYVKINGEMHCLWRAVDQEGEVLESFVTKTRDKKAALAFMKKALNRHGLRQQRARESCANRRRVAIRLTASPVILKKLLSASLRYQRKSAELRPANRVRQMSRR